MFLKLFILAALATPFVQTAGPGPACDCAPICACDDCRCGLPQCDCPGCPDCDCGPTCTCPDCDCSAGGCACDAGAACDCGPICACGGASE